MLQHLWIVLDVDLSNESGVQVLVASGGLVLLLIAGFVVVSRVRQRFQSTDEPAAEGFTLSDLRQLYKEGQMSTEEFEKAKAAAVEAAKRAADRAQERQQTKGRRSG